VSKKIVIIGAGMAGLSAGIHARRNGYETEIYEMHHLPGGLCAAWDRKGYTFDGCIHWLVGTKPGSQFNRLWREVGALEDEAVINREIFLTVEGEQGRVIHIYSDLDRLQEHLLECAPNDAEIIKSLVSAAKALATAEFPLEKPEELYKPWDLPLMLFKMMPYFKIMGQLSRISVAEYLKRFKDPLLREALSLIMPNGYSMISLASTLASLHSGDTGFPRGGSLKFARSLEKRYLDLGGKINYNARVSEVLVENGQAVGLLLEDGRRVDGDIVISAADLHLTAYELLKKKYLTAKIKDSFADLGHYTSVQVSLGVNCDLSGEAENVAVKLDQPIMLGSEKNNYIFLTNFAADSTLAIEGKTVVRTTLYSTYDYWEGLAKDKQRYREKKEQIADQVIKIVEKRFPAVRGKVEVVDVATPLTYNRYTGVWKGAYMAWIVPPDAGRFSIPKELPGLSNFYQVGQWVMPPAGLPGSMVTGRYAVQIICKRDKKRFRKN
jgi:phytoene dehydrogenase-like protein